MPNILPMKLTFVLAPILLVPLAQSQTITVIGWNAESGDANPAVVSQRIAATEGWDIWGIVEVTGDTWAAQFEVAAEDGEGADFVCVLGSTGGADKMVIIYDGERFTQIGTAFELPETDPWGTVRKTLGVRVDRECQVHCRQDPYPFQCSRRRE